jgi:hypothetical protein
MAWYLVKNRGNFYFTLNTNPFRYFGRTPWTGDRPNARPLPTQDSAIQKNADITFIPRAGIESTIPVFERSKTYALYTAQPLGPA